MHCSGCWKTKRMTTCLGCRVGVGGSWRPKVTSARWRRCSCSTGMCTCATTQCMPMPRQVLMCSHHNICHRAICLVISGSMQCLQCDMHVSMSAHIGGSFQLAEKSTNLLHAQIHYQQMRAEVFSMHVLAAGARVLHELLQDQPCSPQHESCDPACLCPAPGQPV